FGALHLLLRGAGPVGLVVEIMAIAAALLVMCYQGFAMAHSESFALWANPLVPAASLCYALTAGLLLTWTLSDGSLGAIEQNLRLLSVAALVADVLILVSLLTLAGRKSRGGAFSAHLLTRGEYAAPFWGLTVLLGLALPLGLTVLLPTPTPLTGIVIAAAAMLSGFLALRILLFKAAVYEPIANDIIGSLGLSMLRS
ncbi:MAG: polysulfide reductase NrfD, partial [Proteobacteria bacterium]|nr:polysulfide reductase NrfD [Pseudomonadota bacterium]